MHAGENGHDALQKVNVRKIRRRDGLPEFAGKILAIRHGLVADKGHEIRLVTRGNLEIPLSGPLIVPTRNPKGHVLFAVGYPLFDGRDGLEGPALGTPILHGP